MLYIELCCSLQTLEKHKCYDMHCLLERRCSMIARHPEVLDFILWAGGQSVCSLLIVVICSVFRGFA